MTQRRESWTLAGALAIPGFALMLMGAQRRNALLVIVGALMLGRGARLVPRGLLNP